MPRSLGGQAALGLLILFALWPLWPQAVAQEARSVRQLSQYVYRDWQDRDGLPHSTVNALTQTPDGYLWVGTDEGLARFNGLQFDLVGQQELLDEGNDINALWPSQQGGLWIGYSAGLLYQDADSLHRIHPPDADSLRGRGPMWVNTLHEQADGSLWVGTQQYGLLRWRDSTWTDLMLHQHKVKTLHEDHTGMLWAGTDQGLYRWVNTQWIREPWTQSTTQPQVGALLDDGQGALWVGTDQGLFQMVDGQWTAPPAGVRWPRVGVAALLKDREGNIWIGTDQDLQRYSGGLLTSFTEEDGLPAMRVTTLYEDKQGSIWAGTERGGLSQFKAGPVVAYGPPEGLSVDKGLTVLVTPDSTTLVGTEQGLYAIQAGVVRYLDEEDGVPTGTITSLAYEREGLWMGTLRSGLFRRTEAGTQSWSEADGLPSNDIYGLLASRQGGAWVSTSNGLAHIDTAGTITAPFDQLLTSRQPLTILEGRDGSVWVGTYDAGLFHMNQGGVTHYGPDDGLGSPMITALHEDEEGALWIGTYEGGLSVLRDSSLTTFTASDGLYDNSIYAILEDPMGTLWMSCNRGIFWVDKAVLEDVQEGDVDRIPSAALTHAHGMRSSDATGGLQPVASWGPDGRIWVPTSAGVVSVLPDAVERNEPPPLLIEDVTLDGVLLPRSSYYGEERMTIEPGQHTLVFSFAAITFAAPEEVRYRYRLEGYDRTWKEANQVLEATYTNLSPGTYTLMVEARSGDGTWEARVGVPFVLAPYLYQRVGFWLAMLLLLALLGAGGYQYQVHRLKARQRELEDEVQSRTQDLRLAMAEVEMKTDELRELNEALEAEVETQLQQRLKEREDAQRHIAWQATLLDKAQDAILVLNDDHRITYWNKAAERLYGWTAADVAGQDVRRLIFRIGDQVLREAFEATQDQGEWTGEMCHVTRTNAERIVESRWTRVDSDAEEQALLLISTDVTDQRALETRHHQVQRMESIEAMASGIAADLNAVLSPILMAVQMLQSQHHDERSQKLLTRLYKSAERGVRLVQQMFYITSSQERVATRQPVRQLIAEALTVIMDNAPTSFNLSPPPSCSDAFTIGDAQQLRQVLVDLGLELGEASRWEAGLRVDVETVELRLDAMPAHSVPGFYHSLCLATEGHAVEAGQATWLMLDEAADAGLRLVAATSVIQAHGGLIQVSQDRYRRMAYWVYLPVATEIKGDPAPESVS